MPPAADQRIRAAAALAKRDLPKPTPQIVNAQRNVTAPAFDRERYLADPQAYLDVASPTRALEPAQPAADVPMLEPVGAMAPTIAPGGSVVLRAKTDPGMPLNFMSSGLGSFDSGLTSISVAADEQGIAEARFTATRGTVGPCPIIAASPVRGGTIRFLVTVRK